MTRSLHPRHPSAAARCRPGFRPEALEARTFLADAGTLLADINATTESSSPTPLAEFAGQVVFAAETPAAGRELWITDNSAAGARLFADVRPGPTGSNPLDAVSLADRLVFWANDAAGVPRLWSADAAGAVTPLSPTLRAGHLSTSTKIVTLNGRAYVYAVDGPGDTAPAGIFATDGTPAGTARVANVPAISDIVPFAGAVVFVRSQINYGVGTVVRLDPDGTTTDLTPAGVGAYRLRPAGDTLLFTGNADPWRTDGTPGGTRQVADLTGNLAAAVQSAVRLSNGRILFVAGTPRGVYALNTDGTVTGPLYANDVTDELAAVGNRAFFSAHAPTGYRGALMTTDGTEAGTRLVKDFPLVPRIVNAPRPAHLTALGSRLVFRAATADAGWELWSSDGTTAGTSLVRDINPGTPMGLPIPGYHPVSRDALAGPFLTAGGRAFFTATDPQAGTEPWATDGTAAGTRRLADVNAITRDALFHFAYPGPAYAAAVSGVEFAGRTWFAAQDGLHGWELWTTDGTAQGTRLALDLLPGADPSDPADLLVHGGALYVVANYRDSLGALRVGVYRTDGTPAGTVRLGAPYNGYNVVGERDRPLLHAFKNKVAFLAWRSAGVQLWTTDGTHAGTAPAPGSITLSLNDPYPEDVTVSGDYVYYGFRPNRTSPASLHRHNGTTAEVVMPSPDPTDLTDLDGTLLFGRFGGLFAVPQSGPWRELFNGPVHVEEIVRVGEVVYVGGGDAAGRGLWVTDGTDAGTRRVYDGAAWTRGPMFMTPLGGRVWFMASSDSTTGDFDAWVTDGTAAGTRRVADLPPTTYPGAPLWPGPDPMFTAAPDGTVYFRAASEADGVKVHAADAAGTTARRVTDLPPEPAAAWPGPFLRAGAHLFVAAEHPQAGREWLALPTVPPVRAVVGRHVFYNNSAFDGGLAAIGATDDGAIAADKSALLQGQAPTYANYTNYTRGLNGIMIDVAGGLPLEELVELTTNVGVQTSPGGPGSAWADAPARFVADVRRGAGVGGSDRITLAWPDGAIRNTWLRVTVPAMPEAGLAQDVFVFGNLIGETGDPSNPARVNANDVAAVKRALTTTAVPAGTPADINKDGRVNALDVAAVKSNLTRALQPPALVAAGAAVIPPADAPAAQTVRRVWDEPEALLF